MAKPKPTAREVIRAAHEAERVLAGIACTRPVTEEESAVARKAYRAAKKAQDAIEKEIEQAYYRLAQGRQINVLQIGNLFKSALTYHVDGADLEAAVAFAIQRYCEPLKGG